MKVRVKIDHGAMAGVLDKGDEVELINKNDGEGCRFEAKNGKIYDDKWIYGCTGKCLADVFDKI